MSKDVILDRYARLYEIPYQLAKLGHTVGAFCLSYQRAEAVCEQHEAAPGQLTWESHPRGKSSLAGFIGYPYTLLRRLHEFKPDLLIGASDISHAVLSAWLSRRLGVPYVVDLYDNFEGFGQARIPGFVSSLRRAVRNAPLVTTTSEPLRELVLRTYRARGDVIAMPSAVDKSIFHPQDKAVCRSALGLPLDVHLIGTAGSLYRDKGIGALYQAWSSIGEQREDVHLVLAGPADSGLPPPTGARVHHLGLLPHARIAELFNSLDVGVICIPDTPFGRYSFPQKAYEMLACRIPLAVTRIGAMPSLFKDVPDSLYEVDDAGSLVKVLLSQLERPLVACAPVKDWESLIGTLEPHLRKVAGLS